jgi:hypothetical protein
MTSSMIICIDSVSSLPLALRIEIKLTISTLD